MKISTKGRYGVHAMLDIALYATDQHIALKTIAERQGISEHYLEQLIAVLRKSGLVRSIRGAQGGYSLAKPADQITVGDILRSLEGSLAPVDCVDDIEPKSCADNEGCVTKMVWTKIRDSINAVVDSITLQDLVEDYKKLAGNENYMYFI